jgi:hypothetical protein
MLSQLNKGKSTYRFLVLVFSDLAGKGRIGSQVLRVETDLVIAGRLP